MNGNIYKKYRQYVSDFPKLELSRDFGLQFHDLQSLGLLNQEGQKLKADVPRKYQQNGLFGATDSITIRCSIFQVIQCKRIPYFPQSPRNIYPDSEICVNSTLISYQAPSKRLLGLLLLSEALIFTTMQLNFEGIDMPDSSKLWIDYDNNCADPLYSKQHKLYISQKGLS